MSDDNTFATRQRLLKAASRQFAERGFHGASIAQIAGELDLTKQALLYHFKRKEDLYAEVLKNISDRLLTTMEKRREPGLDAKDQLERLVLGIYEGASANPVDTKVLMREILDNQRKDVPEEERYLKVFLDSMVGMLDQIDGLKELSFSEKLARIYSVISSIEYFVASSPVLVRFYGEEEFEKVRDAYRADLQAQVRRMVNGAA